MNSTHRYRLSSYPLAYSLIVLPLTIAWWLLFSHHHVLSVATLFPISMFYLSGAINVLLFLIIRLQQLFPCYKQHEEREIQLTHQEDTGPANIPDTAKYQHSPEPTLAHVHFQNNMSAILCHHAGSNSPMALIHMRLHGHNNMLHARRPPQQDMAEEPSIPLTSVTQSLSPSPARISHTHGLLIVSSPLPYRQQASTCTNRVAGRHGP